MHAHILIFLILRRDFINALPHIKGCSHFVQPSTEGKDGKKLAYGIIIEY
jgi:hypothetical protein